MPFKEDFINLLKRYNIIKSEKKEEMVSYEVIYAPDEVDSHGHWASVETLEKACEDFNKNLEAGIVKPNLFHLSETDSFSIESTWIQKEFDVTVAETGEPIKAGTWVGKIKYHDEDLWKMKKMGIIGGVSIGGKGLLNEETGEITSIYFSEPLEDEEDSNGSDD